ncbi:hypothetical protein BVC80_1605g54 [Macleaya cordata]|uniref:Leucine-rich repeat n=1 Tax=Macleaya cordata TaxID=56857 RepID=A0A200QA88_MACCD|nr:hypothetical protein BVC80_1605g54 [Macleaya cordata]
MRGLEEFDLGVNVEGGGGKRGEIIIMPRLNEVNIRNCHKLKTLRVLSKLQSLQVLLLNQLTSLEEFKTIVMVEGGEDYIIFPSLLSLDIRFCPKLNSLQQLQYLPKLNELDILYCPSLFQLPTSPHLTSLRISHSSNPSPLQGLAGLQNLQQLYFMYCSLSCIPEDLRHLTALQMLHIEDDERWELRPNCIDEEEEAWNVMSHIPKIIIMGRWYELISQITPAGRQHYCTIMTTQKQRMMECKAQEFTELYYFYRRDFLKSMKSE